ARGLSTLVPAIRDRTCAGNDDHSGLALEGSLQRDDHVSYYHDLSCEIFGNDRAYPASYFRTRSSGQPNAGARHACKLNLGCGTGVTHHRLKCLTRLLLANTNWVAAHRTSSGQHFILVSHQARGLGAATINADEDCHEISCNIGANPSQ